MAILFDGRFSVDGFLPYGTAYVDTMELCANGTILRTASGGNAVTNAGIPGYIDLVADPAGTGETVMRSRTTRSDANTYGAPRTEIGLNTDALPFPTERWYSWSIFLPEDWEINTTEETIWQVHNYPDTSPAEASVAIPPTMGMYTTTDGRLRVENVYDANATTTSGSPTVRNLFYTSLDRGQWTDWVLHAVWSATAGTGTLRFFKNRRLIFSETNHINTYNDATARGGLGPYMRMGTYYWSAQAGGTIEERIAYYKGFRVGDDTSSFAEVTGTTQLETVSAVNAALL